MKPFYVRHKNREEAIEVIDRAVANGAELDEGVADVHSRPSGGGCYSFPNNWEMIGISEFNTTLFHDYSSAYGEGAIELTIKDVRLMYPLPEERNDSRDTEGISGETEGRKFKEGDLVRYGPEKQYTGYVVGYSIEGRVVFELDEEELHRWRLYDSTSEEELELVENSEESLLEQITQILESQQWDESESYAKAILKLFNKGEEK